MKKYVITFCEILLESEEVVAGSISEARNKGDEIAENMRNGNDVRVYDISVEE